MLCTHIKFKRSAPTLNSGMLSKAVFVQEYIQDRSMIMQLWEWNSFIQNGFIVSHLAAVKLNCMWFTYIKSYNKIYIHVYKFNIVYIIIMHLK